MTTSPLPPELQRIQFIDEHQAAALLGISRGTLSNWRSSGRGPKFSRLGRAVRYRTDVLLAWTDENSGGGK